MSKTIEERIESAADKCDGGGLSSEMWDLLEELKTLHEAVPALSKWTQHHSSCARVVEAGDCDCGLSATWAPIMERYT